MERQTPQTVLDLHGGEGSDDPLFLSGDLAQAVRVFRGARKGRASEHAMDTVEVRITRDPGNRSGLDLVGCLAALCRARRVAVRCRLGPGGVFDFGGRFGRFRLVLIEGRVLGVAAVERVFGLEAVERIGAPGLGHVGEAVGAKLFQHRRLGLRADRRVGGDQQRFSRAGMDAGFSMS
ncbi:hypothetical protein CVT23_14500, partial [Minwuia thermotolerans]